MRRRTATQRWTGRSRRTNSAARVSRMTLTDETPLPGEVPAVMNGMIP